jgi:hypothetical protein
MGLDPGNQFTRAKWLDQVIVGAAPEPFDA